MAGNNGTQDACHNEENLYVYLGIFLKSYHYKTDSRRSDIVRGSRLSALCITFGRQGLLSHYISDGSHWGRESVF